GRRPSGGLVRFGEFADDGRGGLARVPPLPRLLDVRRGRDEEVADVRAGGATLQFDAGEVALRERAEPAGEIAAVRMAGRPGRLTLRSLALPARSGFG